MYCCKLSDWELPQCALLEFDILDSDLPPPSSFGFLMLFSRLPATEKLTAPPASMGAALVPLRFNNCEC